MLLSLLTVKPKTSIQELDEWINYMQHPLKENLQWFQVSREELIEAKASASIEELYEKSNLIARKIIDSGLSRQV